MDLAMFFNKSFTASIFTQDSEIDSIIVKALSPVCAYIFFDALHGANTGIIRALGYQFVASIWTLFCYYILGLPLALYFAFDKELNVQGMWYGFLIAMILLDLGISLGLYFGNWEPLKETKVDEDTGDDFKHVQ